MMETGVFILIRWILTFGVLIGWGICEAQQTTRRQRERAEVRA